jgi:hypothetical protein
LEEAGSPAPEAARPAIAESCRSDLARRLKLDPGLIAVKSSEAVDWPDAALGLPRRGEVVAQVLTPGQRVILKVEPQGREYLYTASEKDIRYGGPLDLWQVSALTLEDAEGDPNLNGRLVQCSLIGTNRGTILEGIADFYPQEGGSLFAKRRTSRSGHDLLFAVPGRTSGPSAVAAGFDFVDAAVSPDQTTGAAIVRRGPGPAWELILFPLPLDKPPARRVGLPEGLKPQALRWRRSESGGSVPTYSSGWPSLVLLGNMGGKPARFGLSESGGSPRWDALPSYVGSEEWDFVLSKSHSLSVYEAELEGGPAVRVEYVWWNRGPEEIATLRGLKLDGFEWAVGRQFVFITGRTAEGHAAMTVDIDTGEVVTAATKAAGAVKLFKFPPLAGPLPRTTE